MQPNKSGFARALGRWPLVGWPARITARVAALERAAQLGGIFGCEFARIAARVAALERAPEAARNERTDDHDFFAEKLRAAEARIAAIESEARDRAGKESRAAARARQTAEALSRDRLGLDRLPRDFRDLVDWERLGIEPPA